MSGVFDSVIANKSVISQFSKWDDFYEALSSDDAIALIYNSDIDGLLGAVYTMNAIANKISSGSIYPYHIGTDEYDFIDFNSWIDRNNFTKCIFVDVSIENNPDVLKLIQKSVKGSIFIYDHHMVRVEILPDEAIIIANPTPKKLEKGEFPIPTFLFSLYLSQKHNFYLPNWLLLTAIFAEGVDSFFYQQIEELYLSVFGQKIQRKNQRKAFGNSPLSKISSFVRAGFTDREEGYAILDAFSLDKLEAGYNELVQSLSERYSEKAREISNEISSNVDKQIALIKAEEINDKVIIIEVDNYPSATGPTASILRQYFPEKVFLSYYRNRNNVMFEIRVVNNSPINLVSILDLLSSQISFYNYGGHPMAAGGLLKTDDLQLFLDAFVSYFERG